jgi:hypothetical protein
VDCEGKDWNKNGKNGGEWVLSMAKMIVAFLIRRQRLPGQTEGGRAAAAAAPLLIIVDQ